MAELKGSTPALAPKQSIYTIEGTQYNEAMGALSDARSVLALALDKLNDEDAHGSDSVTALYVVKAFLKLASDRLFGAEGPGAEKGVRHE